MDLFHGQIIMKEDGTFLECFDHHLFPRRGYVEWRYTDKYGPPERGKVFLKVMED